MLLTELILSKRGPLAKVWLSAHQDRKLSKQQALGVDVEESVDAILEQDDGPTTLRLSGQLMLGVTRIYSRKVQYLLDDCQETRERIIMAFRPGIVDLPEDQQRANKNAITFSDIPNDFNFFDWSWTANLGDAGRLQPRPPAPANLRPATKEFGAYNFGRPRVPSIYGGSSSSRRTPQDGESSSHLDSADFSGIDLGLQLDDMDMSIEQGRHESVRPERLGMSRDRSIGYRTGSVDFGAQGGMDVTFDSVDLGLDFGGGMELPELEGRSRRETSRLTTPPPLSPEEGAQLDVTPRTAARMQRQTQAKPKRPRLLQEDAEIEMLDDDLAADDHDNSAILTVERYIPSDPEVIRLDDISENPNAYFLPNIDVNGVSMIYTGPEGLAPYLQPLFSFPPNILRRFRDDEPTQPSSKRPRIEGEEDEVEFARRQSRVPSEHGLDISGGAFGDFFDDTVGGGDISMPDIPELGPVPRFSTPIRQPSLAPSRAESIAREVQYGGQEGDYTLAMFAPSARRVERGDGESQIETPTKSVTESRTSSGYSKNTGMAMGLLRREIEAIEGEIMEEKVVRFDKVSQGATRRAASSFFFELLVLGTKDFIQLDQPTSFGDIAVTGKARLFEDIAA